MNDRTRSCPRSPAPEGGSAFASRRLHRRHRSWLHGHSLTVVLVLTWTGWIWRYVRIDSNGKAGQVVGNIVSEWSQILSLVWFTKYLIERGSKQSHG
jgi:hypothetical protein